MADRDAAQWYYCTRHERVEPANGCPAAFRMGPYPSPEAAAAYADTAEARNDAWQEEDERWEGC